MFPRLAFLLLSAVVCVTPYEAPKKFVLPLMDSETQPVATATPQQLLGLSMHSAARLAAEYINNNTLGILPNTTLILDSVSDHNTPAIGVSKMVEFADRGHTFVVGSPFSAVAVQTGIVGSVYGVAQLSPLAGAAILANSKEYPFFSRLGSDTVDMAQVMKETILHYGSLAGIGWNQVAVIVQLTDFTIDIASAFVTNAQPQLEVLVYQSFLPGRGMDILVELNEIKKSGARIILGLIFSDWLDFLSACDSVGLIGEQYVYFGVPTLRSSPLVGDTNLSRGVLIPYTGTPVPTAEFMEFAKLWQSVDPMEYPLAGPGTFPTPFAAKNFDMIVTAAKAIDILNSKEFLDGRRIPAEEWSATIREISFNGASGPIVFDPDGNIIEELGILYFSPENGWVRAGNYSVEQGYKELSPIVWYSNSTELPDLDVRPPIDYWSCHAKERGYDETGKQIILQTPDGSDVDDIDYSYHCDLFIDCKNLSDETVDCSTNYIIIYALFGVITGLLILACFFLILFVIIFGLILKYSRVRNRSPVFLIIQLLSAILGFTSVYTWFGKPHPVACGFQAWLLGLSTVSMISSLSVKNFRIWRIFRFPLKKTKVTDWELLVYWGITIFPAVIILLLWTIISTPSAALKTRDGQKHYVCTTGGFTGEPGGLIFFSILVAYNAVILLFGVFISFAVQNVPSMFNESKLLKVSIYNLGFLAIIIIPVYFVLIPFDPFSAWIIRTIAIIYAFGATIMLQFIPILGGIFILDKGSDRFATNTMFVNRSTT